MLLLLAKFVWVYFERVLWLDGGKRDEFFPLQQLSKILSISPIMLHNSWLTQWCKKGEFGLADKTVLPIYCPVTHLKFMSLLDPIFNENWLRTYNALLSLTECLIFWGLTLSFLSIHFVFLSYLDYVDMNNNMNSMLKTNRVRQRNLDLTKALVTVKTKEELRKFE